MHHRARLRSCLELLHWEEVTHRPAHADRVSQIHIMQGLRYRTDFGNGKFHGVINSSHRGNTERCLAHAKG